MRKNFPKPKCKTQTCLGSTPNATSNMSQIWRLSKVFGMTSSLCRRIFTEIKLGGIKYGHKFIYYIASFYLPDFIIESGKIQGILA